MAKLSNATVGAGDYIKTHTGFRMILSCAGREDTGFTFVMTPCAKTISAIQPVAFSKIISQAYAEKMGWHKVPAPTGEVCVTLDQIAAIMGVPAESLRICS